VNVQSHPQAASIWQGLLRSSERRPAATVCGYYGTVRRYERGPHACGNRRFRVFLKDFQCIQHRRIICFYSEYHNIQSDRSCGFEFESIERFTNDHSVVHLGVAVTRGKNVACDENRVARALFSRNAVREALTPKSDWGEDMATIPMIPLGPVATLNRSILLTERGMACTGGDDFICGHCGHVMLEDFDPSTIRGNPVYQCGVCENNNHLPSAASDGRHWPSW
jgi:hypothetical protein